jgi:uncharacterized protein YvpB
MKKIISFIMGTLCIIFILYLFNNYRIDKRIADDIESITRDKKYEKTIELKDLPIYSQLYDYSCGPTTMSMVYSYLERPKAEKELQSELSLESRKKGMLPKTFLKYIRLSLKEYDITLENNISDTEVLKLIYSQLEKGIPVPIYFSTINDWDKRNYDTHYSAVTGISMKDDKIVISNAYGFREEVKMKDFLNSLKYENFKNKPLYLTISTFFGVIKKNNIYVINKR